MYYEQKKAGNEKITDSEKAAKPGVKMKNVKRMTEKTTKEIGGRDAGIKNKISPTKYHDF